MTKLVMGSIVCMGPNDDEAIPYDEAVIHLEGDEDSEINVHCPGALRLAPVIVYAVNNHEVLVKALQDIAGLSVHSLRAGQIARKALADAVGNALPSSETNR